MKISISDDLAETLLSQLRDGQDLDALIERRLAELSYIPLGERFLPLTHADRDAIGMAAGRTIPPQTVGQIITYIERLGQIRLGDIKIDFSAGQLEEVARMAAREHKSPAEYAGRIAATILSQFFRSPGAAGELPVVTVIETVEGAPTPTSA